MTGFPVERIIPYVVWCVNMENRYITGKYITGQKVRIIKQVAREDLFRFYNSIVTIRYGITDERQRHYKYAVEENLFVWDEDWLEPVEPDIDINTEDILCLFSG